MNILRIEDLHVEVEKTEIIKGISLTVKEGEVTVLMGPNGSGKSSLAHTLMGHPKYIVTKGKIYFNDIDITEMEPNERAKLGLFLSFQYPAEISGVSVANFLRVALSSLKGQKIHVMDFKKILEEKLALLQMDRSFITRYLNEGFSGGEKKKNEILQLAVLEPKIAILDETDSGTDVDALKVISQGINTIKEKTGMGCLIITHYNRILQYIKADRVVVMVNGKIVKEGTKALADDIEAKGYATMLA